jgi:predicted nucleic-acid-binding protein
MIGLDSNIIIRLLVQDDPAQSRIAAELLKDRLTIDQPGFVSVVAIAEIAWVLGRIYRFPQRAIADAMEELLGNEALVVDREEAVFDAVSKVRLGLGSFGDALIGALNAEAGCERTLSFDRGALNLPGFEHP